MILHQSIPEEAEMMQFLIDEEQGVGQNIRGPSLKKFEDVDKMLEQALDGLEFNKYMTLTRMQAMNSAIKRCKDRNENRGTSDSRILIYAEWLVGKQKNAQKYEQEIRAENQQLRKTNNTKI